MRLHVSRRDACVIAALGLSLIIILPILIYPRTTTAQATYGTGFSSRERLMMIASRFPAFAQMIQETNTLERAPDWVPAGEAGRTPQLLVLDSYKVYYFRYVQAVCYVKASSFAPLKVDWAGWGVPGYVGDCFFYVQYGARYEGDIPMPDPKTITDAWKKSMKFNVDPSDLKAPYYWLGGWWWDCSDPDMPLDFRNAVCRGDAAEFTACGSVTGAYDPGSGSFSTTIGDTPGAKWSCGVDMALLTNKGADLSVLSPKPAVKAAEIPKTLVPGTRYAMQINMKGFGIKTPAPSKQSSWDKIWWYLEGPPWHVADEVGMWADHIEPYWWYDAWGDHPGPSWGGAQWYYTNPGWNRPYFVPATPTALFQPSSVSLNYKKSDTIVGPNAYDGAKNTGFLYHAVLDIGYMHKGIGFIIGDRLSFSGNPEEIQPIDCYSDPDLGPGWTWVGVYWDLQLEAAYPDYTCAWSCEVP